MTQVILYTKSGCGLCDEVKSILEEIETDLPHQLREVDIESDEDLSSRYWDRVPVLKIGPYTLEAPIQRVDIEVAIRAASNSVSAMENTSSTMPRSRALSLNRGLLFFARHWLAIFNLIVFLYVSLPFAAPALMKAGAERPARVIYSIYKPLCHPVIR
jgi:glutaredoxin